MRSEEFDTASGQVCHNIIRCGSQTSAGCNVHEAASRAFAVTLALLLAYLAAWKRTFAIPTRFVGSIRSMTPGVFSFGVNIILQYPGLRYSHAAASLTLRLILTEQDADHVGW